MFALLISLMTLLYLAYYLNNKDLLSPAFVFTTSFLFASIWATIYKKAWDLELHFNTFILIIASVFLFLITAVIVKLIYKNFKRKKFKLQNIEEKEDNERKLNIIFIETIKKIIFIVIELITIVSILIFLTKANGGNIFNISGALYNLRIKNFRETTINFPKIISVLRLLVGVLGYYFSYILINNYIVEKKIDKYSLIIVVLSIFSSALIGARGNTIDMILSMFAIAFILVNKKNLFKMKIKFKTIVLICLAVLVILINFQQFGNLLGRNNKVKAMDYLAEYCGAEIKNLDTFLQEDTYKAKDTVFGGQTFFAIIKWTSQFISFKNSNYEVVLPFRSVNGFSLGNVYTILYPLVYDFGYMGALSLVIFMALISQILYERCKTDKFDNKPSIRILVYSYVFPTILLSFFSNMFYNLIFNINFIYFIIVNYLLNIFCLKIKIINNHKQY